MRTTGEEPELNPPRHGRWIGPLLLALAAHGLLMLALAWGVAWQKDSQVVLQAELWSSLPQMAAPRAVEPPPPAPPEPVVPAPTPPAPTPPPAPPALPAPAPSAADIALQRAQEQARLQEQRQREEQRRAEQARRQAEREAEERRAAEERRQQQAQRERQARERAEREAAQRREREQLAELEAQRQRNLERILGQAGATGGPQVTGTAQRATGPSASYAGRLVAAIRPNIVLTEIIPGNPRAEVELRTLPDGSILSARLKQSSGHPNWDNAVLRAVERTARLPRDEDGRIPSTIILGFRPQE